MARNRPKSGRRTRNGSCGFGDANTSGPTHGVTPETEESRVRLDERSRDESVPAAIERVEGPSTAIQTLAANGALCECGGIHIPSIAVAILANRARENGENIPCCDCEDCAVCRPLRLALKHLRDGCTIDVPRFGL
jgi:hypothetical protein